MSQGSQERAKGQIPRKLPSELRTPPMTHPGDSEASWRFVLEALECIFEALGGVLEALGGVLEAKMRQDNAKMPSERTKSEVSR